MVYLVLTRAGYDELIAQRGFTPSSLWVAAAMNVLINIENPVSVLVTRIGALRLKLAAGHPVKEVDRQRQTINQWALPARNRQPVENAASASGMNASDTNIQYLPIEARPSMGAARGLLLSCS